MTGKLKKRLHLDFHNHPTVKGIGEHLTPDGFADSLKRLGVDSVVLFAKCHHGMSYYPTPIGVPHPGMAGDLLTAQAQACESAGIEYHLYLSVLRDNYAFEHHPEWRWIGGDGQPDSQDREYRTVCINTPYYSDYLKPQIEETLDRYPNCSGIWLDIIRYRGGACYCPQCREDAERLGLSPREFNEQMTLHRFRELQDICKARGKELTLNTFVFLGNQQWRSLSPIEIESILAHVGPFHFPLFSRYLNRYPTERYGITHSFYQNWREFGTMKHPAQMRYEVCQMAFSGFGASLGDELEPDGTFDLRRFPVLESGYRMVDRLNEVCDVDLPPVPEMAVVTAGLEAAQEDGQSRGDQDSFVRGAFKALVESHRQVAVLDPEENFSPYRALVLSAASLESEPVRSRLDEYLAAGGRVLAMGTAGTAGLSWLGLERLSRANADYQFLELQRGERRLVRGTGETLDITGDLKPVLSSYLPFGDRELGARESSCIRPADPSSRFDSVFAGHHGRLIYCLPDLASDYWARGNWAVGELMESMLGLLDVCPLVCGNIPAATEVWLCADERSIELRALDCSLKRENVPFAQQTEYGITRSYRFEVEQIVPVSRIEDRVTGNALPFTVEGRRIVVETESREPYVVLRLS